MRTIKNFDFNGKRALIRVDFNVPLDEQFNITDTTRIDAAVPTIKYVLSHGGSVILMSHLGRPKDGPTDKYSLSHVLKYLTEVLDTDVKFAEDCIGDEAVKISSTLKAGEVLLLENLRFYKEEEKGDEAFAEKLSKLGDCYINDAFGTAHRAHASTAIIAKFFPEAKMFGYLMENEVMSIKKVMEHPDRPFTAILGGSKVSSKLEILKSLIEKVDNLIIGGGMTYTFIKAKGGKIGNSLCEDDLLQAALDILADAKKRGVNIYLAIDNLCADSFSNDAKREVCCSTKIKDGWQGLDIGPATCEVFREVILNSKTILWNGPMGVFEFENFAHGTEIIAYSIEEATEKGAYSLVGGGDSVAAVNKYDLADKMSYVSTGGGAMLEAIEGKELPGVAYILK